MKQNSREQYRKAFIAYLRTGARIELSLKQSFTPAEQYCWRTAEDNKVRPEHGINNGKICDTNNPPNGVNPGDDYDCRCKAIPIVENRYGGNGYLAVDRLFDELFEGEGNIPHMYLDTAKLVTIGKGIQIETIEEAVRYDFRDKDTGKPASRQQIIDDFHAVQNLYASGNGNTNNIRAERYASITQLRLPQQEIDRIARDYLVERALKEVKIAVPEFDELPLPAQVALLDMVYNLGLGNETRRTGLMGYPSMRRAITAHDWQRVADESYRHGPSEERNGWTYELFLEAGRIQNAIDN